MFKRAANCVVIAFIAAIFGFTGILHWTAGLAQSVFFVSLAISILSLLFGLFEEPETPATRVIRLETQPSAAADISNGSAVGMKN